MTIDPGRLARSRMWLEMLLQRDGRENKIGAKPWKWLSENRVADDISYLVAQSLRSQQPREGAKISDATM
jgi:hypothetical protein